MRELEHEVNRMAAALVDERTKGFEAAKMLAEAAKDKLELTWQHHEEMERAKMALNRVQTTYQKQLMQYQGQDEATAILLKQLKDGKWVVEEKSKMGLDHIRDIVMTWRDRTKKLVEESSVQWCSKWAKQVAEL